MKKSYDASKRRDMERFMEDLQSDVKDQILQEAQSMEYDVECPFCHQGVRIKPGKHPCPLCGETIRLSLDASKIDF